MLESSPVFSQEELNRYNKHLMLPKFGIAAQQKLKAAKVLVIGAGGLGCPMLLYLAAAGIGTIGIVDHDCIELNNLQRQILYDRIDIGKLKVEVAKQKLLKINPHIAIETYGTSITSENASELFKQYDIVADGTDNISARYIINDACIAAGIANVYASVNQFQGQISVFNLIEKEGTIGPSYRDLFPEPKSFENSANCSEIGVLGVLPGIIGTMQANEIIKIITGIGETLSGKLLVFDALNYSTQLFEIVKHTKN